MRCVSVYIVFYCTELYYSVMHCIMCCMLCRFPPLGSSATGAWRAVTTLTLLPSARSKYNLKRDNDESDGRLYPTAVWKRTTLFCCCFMSTVTYRCMEEDHAVLLSFYVDCNLQLHRRGPRFFAVVLCRP
jgi:hypothetical protein